MIILSLLDETGAPHDQLDSLHIPFLALPDMLYARETQAHPPAFLVPSIACGFAKVFNRYLLADLYIDHSESSVGGA